MMRELSLFTGAGGGLLGTHLLGWRPVGYVEFNDYCQRVIAQRIADGILPNAPIFGDVRQFVESGAAAQYRGFADVVTGGFPCQPFSVAGKRAGADDARNMWPATIATIRAVRPRYAFLENVPGILSSGYFGTILRDLAESGYDCRWRVLSAAELGAPHKRDRLWICAYTQGERARGLPVRQGRPQQASTDTYRLGEDVADTNGMGSEGWRLSERTIEEIAGTGSNSQDAGDSSGARLSNRRASQVGQPGAQSQLKRPSWWEVEPPLGRVVDGYAGRVDELKAIGNAQVASVAAAAWRLLTQ